MRLANIGNLGIKELRSLVRDPIMLVLIAYSFTIAIYAAATVMPETLQKAPIAIVDEDRSPLSVRIVDGFALPYFQPPHLIDQSEMRAWTPAWTPSPSTSRPTSSATCWPAGSRPSSSTSTPPACRRPFPAPPTSRPSS